MLVHQFWLGHIQSLLARRVANHEPEHQVGIMVKKKVFFNDVDGKKIQRTVFFSFGHIKQTDLYLLFIVIYLLVYTLTSISVLC